MMNQKSLFDLVPGLRGRPEPRARRTDPETSHAAADSVTALTARRAAVLQVLRDCGPLTDEAIAEVYTVGDWSEACRLPEQSPSGLRTRRCELCKMGLVRNSGKRAKLGSGRQAILWEVTSGKSD